MPVAPDVQSLNTAAEQAASGGDFASAAHYLSLAADLQEAGAGSMPAELANTLNNLGVVYERLDRPIDAERCYRRAHAVARAVLDPGHPSVALSEKNLRDFCDGRGIPFDEKPAAAAPPPQPAPKVHVVPAPAIPVAAAPAPAPPAPIDEPPAGSKSPMLVLGTLGALALAAAVLIGIRVFGTNAVPDSAPAAAPAASTPAPAAAAPPPAVEPPPPVPAASEPAPSAAEPAPAKPVPEPVRAAPERIAKPAVVPRVVSAALCGTLDTRGGNWQCGPATGAPGTFFFLTRLAAPAATAVEHRWYRDGRLHQAVPLRVAANPQQGYRTYSRLVISAERAGDWRVELRASDGAVLHEERFTVAR
jgi:hypothetical protein